MTSGFLVWSSLRDKEDAAKINDATKAKLAARLDFNSSDVVLNA